MAFPNAPKSGTSADVLDANSVAMSSSTEWEVCGGRSSYHLVAMVVYDD